MARRDAFQAIAAAIVGSIPRQPVWYVKVRKTGQRRWRFVAPKGETCTLKVHACRWESLDHAYLSLDLMTKANPGLEFRVVEAG